MKKLILTFGIFLAGIFFVNAQDKAATKMVNHLTQVCALTPDQASKLQPIAENYLKTRRANKMQYTNSPDSLRIADRANNKSYKAQLDAILTPDQQQKLKDYRTQQKAQRQANKQGEQSDGDNDGGQQ